MKTLIIGTGNILMADEGFGPYIITELEAERLPEGVDLLDAGTATLDIADTLSGYERLIIIDTIKAGGAPGKIYKFSPEDIRQKSQTQFSLHQSTLLDTINMLRLTKDAPVDITIFAIEPEDVSMKIGISDRLKEKVAVLKVLLKKELGVIPVKTGIQGCT